MGLLGCYKRLQHPNKWDWIFVRLGFDAPSDEEILDSYNDFVWLFVDLLNTRLYPCHIY
jgi:hypothetical protein